MEKQDLIETHYTLGKALAQIDAHVEALEALNKCLELDPLAYRVRPDLLGALGESFFATQQYAKATEYLLWYLNLASSTARRDMILAKLAESLLQQKEPAQAKRIYSYIERYYPGTEGNVISKIRRAESLEKRPGGGKETARFIYQDLADKGLNGPLSEYVLFRLASWERDQANYDKSLEVIEQALKANPSPKSREELLTLRSRVVLDALKAAAEKKDNPRVIALYNDHTAMIQAPENVAMLEAVADACLALKLYPNALELYKQVQNHGKKEDDLILKIARCYYLVGEYDRSAHQLQSIHSEKLADQKADLLGHIAFTLGQFKEAVQHFSKIMAKDADIVRADLETVFAYAESLIETGKHAEALDLLGKATQCPGAGEASIRLQMGLLQSKCFLSLKQQDKAIATLEQLLTADPPEHLRDLLNYRLSELYLEKQQLDKAKEKLSQLGSSSQGLWKAAAQQQLDYLEMQSRGQVKND
jgi:tetratricopeptide (TPR) repeat protein